MRRHHSGEQYLRALAGPPSATDCCCAQGGHSEAQRRAGWCLRSWMPPTARLRLSPFEAVSISCPPRSGNGWSSKVRPGPPGSWCRALCCTKTVKHSRAVGVNRAASAGRSVVLVARAVSAGTRPNEMNHVHRFVRGAKRAEKLTLVAWARHAWALVGSATPSRCRKSRWSAQQSARPRRVGRRQTRSSVQARATHQTAAVCIPHCCRRPPSLHQLLSMSSSVAWHVRTHHARSFEMLLPFLS